MQFKHLFNIKNIWRMLILAFVVFLALPIIFPETANIRIIKRENLFTREDSPLPIFPKENLVQKYLTSLKKFYKMESQDFNTPEMEVQNIIERDEEDITAADLFFTDDYDDEDIYSFANASVNADNSVNLQKGTVLTKDGHTLEPTQEGYYNKGKFYKNGTYPQNADKIAIEGALSRYHNSIAKKLGKKALYYADDDGNLTVDYIDNLPYNISSGIDNYLAKNPIQINSNNKNISGNNSDVTAKNFNTNYDKYRGAHINSLNNKEIKNSDIAMASLSNMHAAYNLVQNKITSGEIGKDIEIQKPNTQNTALNNFLNSSGSTNITITTNPEGNQNESNYQGDPEEISTMVVGDQNFAQNYADGIHELNCSNADTPTKMNQEIPIFEPMLSKIDSNINTIICNQAPLVVEQSSSITNSLPEETDFDKFKKELNKVTNQSNKTNVNIMSTDKNFYPVATVLNEEGSITNSEGNKVTVYVTGPKEGASDLADVLQDITFSITDDTNVANQLHDELANYYVLTQNQNTDTIVAFPTKDDKNVFVLTDPNNSYWIKNPKEIEKYPNQYMVKNGVYYKGAIVDKRAIGSMVNARKTNLLLVSDEQNTQYLPNGSVLVTVDEKDININSFDPKMVGKNVKMVKTLSETGESQKSKQKNTNKKQDINQQLTIYGLEKNKNK